jgi:hypothetical protein
MFIQHTGVLESIKIKVAASVEDYLYLDQNTLEFTYDGTPYTTDVINVTANIEWYAIVGTGEIASATIVPDSGTGNESTTFTCNEINEDVYEHVSQVDYYKTDGDILMATCNIIQYPE